MDKISRSNTNSNMININDHKISSHTQSMIALNKVIKIQDSQINARKELIFKPMISATINSALFFKDFVVLIDLLEVENPLLGNIAKNISNLIVDFFNQNPNQDIDIDFHSDHLKCHFERTLSQEEKNTEWAYYLSEALELADSKRFKFLVKKLEVVIYNDVLFIHHSAFLNGMPWDSIKDKVQDVLCNHYMTTNEFCKTNDLDAKDLIEKTISSMKGYEDTKFKSFKNEPDARLTATQVRTTEGKIFSLFKTPSEAQKKIIMGQHGFYADQRILGQGAFGAVTMGQNMETLEVVAVKEFKIKRSRNYAEIEVQEFDRIGKGGHLISLQGFAHSTSSSIKSVGINKSYLFMDFAGQYNGEDAVKLLSRTAQLDPIKANKRLAAFALHYIQAVAEIHANGMFHHDIKPANFVHSDNWLYLTDYGLAGKSTKKCEGGTPLYLPPEYNLPSLYESEKHDAFSLGLTLLSLKVGKMAVALKSVPLDLNGSIFTVVFDGEYKGKKGLCSGTKNTEALSGSTLDEVIAKLLARNPIKRITPTEALKLPYFKNNGTALAS